MSKYKKLIFVNDSNQGRQILLNPSKAGGELKSVRLRRGASLPVVQTDVSEQLQEMLDNYNTYGVRIIETKEPSRSSSDADKEDDE